MDEHHQYLQVDDFWRGEAAWEATAPRDVGFIFGPAGVLAIGFLIFLWVFSLLVRRK